MVRIRLILPLVLFAALVAACSPAAPAALPLTQTFDHSPTGFSFKYPADWDYNIPVQGILLSGTPETLENGTPGPIFTVQRSLPISILGDLSGAITRYLEYGPLQHPERWAITAAETDTTIDDRPARVVELEGEENGGKLYTRVIATMSDNTFVYMFVLTVPLADRVRFEPTFDAMLDSVRILE